MNETQHATARNRYTGGLLSQARQVCSGWATLLDDAPTKLALQRLDDFLSQRVSDGACIFPAHPLHALELLQPANVKVVILGQDPYHGPDQAQGLAFSVPDTCRCPPSLRNMFTELRREYPDTPERPSHDLTRWARQGVLLLNTVLTVEAGKPTSHARKGWEGVTDALIRHVAALPQPKVFMLWGNPAQRKQQLIDHPDRNHVLCANHPSPLSARRPPVPFIGCDHFRLANDWLIQNGVDPIRW
jgi:uracil-DNA glycosylase